MSDGVLKAACGAAAAAAVVIAVKGCTLVQPILIPILIQIGKEVARTVGVRVIERALDKLFFIKETQGLTALESGGEGSKVVADPSDPLKGRYRGEIRFERRDI